MSNIFVNKKIKTFLQILGLTIFVYILFKIDYRLFFKEVGSLKWHFLILAVILMILEVLVKSLRWRCVLSSLGIYISRISSLSLEWLGFFLGIVTPGRVGELIKVYFLKHRGYGTFRSFFSIILDRMIDILVLLFLGLLIFLFYLRSIGVYLAAFGAILLLSVLFIFLLVDKRSYLHNFFGRLIKKIFPFDFNDYNHFTFSKFWQGIKSLKKREVVIFLIYLVVGWFFYFSARYAIALSLSLNLSYINIIITSVLVAIVSVLPISVAGLGTREAVIIYLFGLFGLSKEIALLFSLLIFSIDLIVTSFGLIPYLKESSLINKVKQYEFKELG